MNIDFLKTVRLTMSAFNVQVTEVRPPFEELRGFDYGLRAALDPGFDWKALGNSILETARDGELLLCEGFFELRFAIFSPAKGSAVIVGPWTRDYLSREKREWIAEKISPEAAEAVQEYRNGVGVVDERQLLSVLTAVLSAALGDRALEVRETHEFLPLNVAEDTRFFREPRFENELPRAMVEERYAGEARMLEAVRRGDAPAALAAHHRMERFDYGGRFRDSLGQVKNKMIILNTLLRKAIEQGGVHPIYVDDISTRYSLEIEHMEMTQTAELSRRMLQEYCAYVQRYSLRQYSPIVQKILLEINLNLQENHSLKSFAELCHISPSYLSTLFRQEVGSTLIDYINSQRVQRAATLLAGSNMSVSAVANQVGILDVNYFTKLFKKNFGVTPTRYRREQRAR